MRNGIQIWILKNTTNGNGEIIESGNKWVKLDLYEDETIEIKSKLTDYKDIAKKYGDFTQDFDIPATGNNNNNLKYWYNPESNNQNEKYIPAKITIGGVIYKEGFIMINKATVKFTKIINYNIEFSSPISSIKDILGNDKFENIVDDEYFDLPMLWELSDLSIINRLSQKIDDVYYPLIYTKEPIKENPSKVNDSNYYITRDHIRPAISFRSILKAIKAQYGLSFTGAFMNSLLPQSTYIHLNREEKMGTVYRKPLQHSGTYLSNSPHWLVFKDYPNGPYTYFKAETIPGLPHEFIGPYLNNISLGGDFTSGYTVHLQRMYTDGDDNIINEDDYYSNIEFSRTMNSSGTIVLFNAASNLPESYYMTADVWYRILIETDVEISFNAFNLVLNDINNVMYEDSVYRTTTALPSNNHKLMLNVALNLPEMTLIDFLSSMLKMWNLIIIPTEVINEYRLETLNTYQGNSTNTIDITKAIDVTTHEVEKTDYYSIFNFKHAVPEYAYNNWYKASTPDASDYGNYVEDNSNILGKEEYTVETKFNLCYFKNYVNNPLQLHSVIYDDEGETVWNKPTIFYRKPNNTTVKSLRYRQSTSGVPFGTVYNIAYKEETCNVLNRSSNIINQSLTWSQDEITHWIYNSNNFDLQMNLTETYDKNLFTEYYLNLITFLNNKRARLFKMNANFTADLYHKVIVGSKVKIMNNVYKVEEINSNLINGKTKLTLSNFYIGREGNIITD